MCLLHDKSIQEGYKRYFQKQVMPPHCAIWHSWHYKDCCSFEFLLKTDFDGVASDRTLLQVLDTDFSLVIHKEVELSRLHFPQGMDNVPQFCVNRWSRTLRGSAVSSLQMEDHSWQSLSSLQLECNVHFQDPSTKNTTINWAVLMKGHWGSQGACFMSLRLDSVLKEERSQY